MIFLSSFKSQETAYFVSSRLIKSRLKTRKCGGIKFRKWAKY